MLEDFAELRLQTSVCVCFTEWIIHIHLAFQRHRVIRMYAVPLMSNTGLMHTGTTQGNYEWSKLACTSFTEDRTESWSKDDGLRRLMREVLMRDVLTQC